MSKWLDRCKAYSKALKTGEKKLPKESMLILFLCGILLYVISLPVEDTTKQSQQRNKETQMYQETAADNELPTGTQEAYQQRIEEQLEEFLTQIEGVGNVKVLVYMKASQEYIVEKDTPVELSMSEGTSIDGEQEVVKEEKRSEQTIYTVDASGAEVPFITQTKNPEITGVVIAAEGAGQSHIKAQLVRLTMALYGLEANEVDVFVLKKQ